MRTDAQRAARIRYNQSEKGKATTKRYNQSERGKAAILRSTKRYHQTEKGKITRAKQKPNCAAYYRTIIGRLRHVYSGMKRRCENPADRGYKYYGGRGIKVCFKSSDDFVNYVVDELQVDPRGLTIDRINNDGNYERGNIRFVTHKVNCNNRRKGNCGTKD